jgi:hypothetical protein
MKALWNLETDDAERKRGRRVDNELRPRNNDNAVPFTDKASSPFGIPCPS